MSINAQGCTSSHNTRIVNKRVSNHGVSPLAEQKGFLSNRFNVLAKLRDSSVDHYTEERVDDGVQPCKDFYVLSKTNNVHTPLKGTKIMSMLYRPVTILSKILFNCLIMRKLKTCYNVIILRKMLKIFLMLYIHMLHLHFLLWTRLVDMPRNKILPILW